MKLNYIVTIEDPKNHIVRVCIKGEKSSSDDKLVFFLPSWSPGSYLMREYSRNIRTLRASAPNGEVLFHEQIKKGAYEVNWTKSNLKAASNGFEIVYEVYCHELTVRTSHIDESHAFLHGPSYLMGIEDKELRDLEIEYKFPALWSKISTGLKDISTDRNVFKYYAPDYDVLIDAPAEIGCHLTDGFRVDGKDHELAFFGHTLVPEMNLKDDIKKIVEYIANMWGEIPYEKYTFITHFAPNTFGGLEHLNSTALQFCSLRMTKRSDYIMWLSLVAHEYYHTWNVKRIRPKELGPFDYQNENYTKMLWLAEGLTSFMDENLVYRIGLCSLEEYLEMQKKNINRYLSVKGKKFHSLEDSSFNTWIKLYRPDENSNNSSVSYYLKGGIVFFILHTLFAKNGKSITDLQNLLWKSYKERPESGLEDFEVYDMVEKIGGSEIRDEFVRMIETTEDLKLDEAFNELGLELVKNDKPKLSFQCAFDYKEERVFINSVELDGAAYKSGLNAGDELISINNMRLTKSMIDELSNQVKENQSYELLINRLGYIQKVNLVFEKESTSVKEIKIIDKNKAQTLLKF